MNGASPRDPIAIIGIGLRLPKSDDMGAFWGHLIEGRSLISDVPRARWDPQDLQGSADPAVSSRHIRGGFLDDADAFDAEFFRISPREANWMDPQQRFGLEMAWHAIEDAGLRARDLKGTRTGVFMGVCHWDYAELLEKNTTLLDAYTPTGIAFSIIANRISYVFDLQGPSVTNDTACAASLTSVYEAVRAIEAGDCDMALAGGVNLCWSPNHFAAFSKAGMLSKTGQSRAFDEKADGYVRGEGGAMVLLKPLSKAQADGDPIYGVIRGIGINHGGQTNSLTVTNPTAQAELIAGIYRHAGVSPETVSYIEAHGPGTPLGDPIEIAGLKQAFGILASEMGVEPTPESCAIGSVKTNVGHLEGAAGIVGMVKVLAALRHGVLPANCGFETLNPLIDFAESPFHVLGASKPWEPSDGAPRRAGVSSFGFGGSNAHVLLEEAPVSGMSRLTETSDNQTDAVYLIPLSARTPDRLCTLVRRWQAYLAEHSDALDIADIAVTCRSGREPMEVRTLFAVRDIEDLKSALQNAVAPEAAGDVTGDANTVGSGPFGSASDAVTADAVGAEYCAKWAAGEDVDWVSQPGHPTSGTRVRLPIYPFARVRHWVDDTLGLKDPDGVPHPLVHRNLSSVEGVRFETDLKPHNFIWAEHMVAGRQVLPGTAILEMARAAAVLASGSTRGSAGLKMPYTLERVLWRRPVLADDVPTRLSITIGTAERGRFDVGILDPQGRAYAQVRVLAGQADARIEPLADVPSGQISEVSPQLCYTRLRARGVAHGPSFQLLKTVRRTAEGAEATLRLGRSLKPSLTSMTLHPILLDAAIQAWVALDGGAEQDATYETAARAAVPFSCDRIEVRGPCTADMTVRVRPVDEGSREGPSMGGRDLLRLDLDLLDKDGLPQVLIRGLELRFVAALSETAEAVEPAQPGTLKTPEPSGTLFTEVLWKPEAAEPAGLPKTGAATLCLLGVDQARASDIAAAWPGPVEALSVSGGSVRAGLAALHDLVSTTLKTQSGSKHRLLVLTLGDHAEAQRSAAASLLRTAAAEHPSVSGMAVSVSDATDAAWLLTVASQEDALFRAGAEVRYVAGATREVFDLHAHPSALIQPDEAIHSNVLEHVPLIAPWSPASFGVYWITGASRGLGLQVARWLASQASATLVLGSRSGRVPDADVQDLRDRGAAVEVVRCDVADADAVARTVTDLNARHGRLDGVFHTAGILDDGYILTKDAERAAAVMVPKIDGALNLDRSLAASSPDILVLFSSIAAAFGNPGQGDYAAANGFLDGFAEWRDRNRDGKTVSIAWPLWADGGMGVDATGLAALEKRFGSVPLPLDVGLGALAAFMADQGSRRGVLHGDLGRMKTLLEPPEPEVVQPCAQGGERESSESVVLKPRIVTLVRDILAEGLEVEPDRIRANRKLEEYGLDSIVIVETVTRLEDMVGPLPKTLFFEHVDLNGIAAYLAEHHGDAFAAALPEAKPSPPDGIEVPISVPTSAPARVQQVESISPINTATAGQGETRAGTQSGGTQSGPDAPVASDRQVRNSKHDIAIVGVSLRCADTRDLDGFWHMLSNGIDGFEPVPQARWDHLGILHPERDILGKTVVRSGVFMDDIDKFDPRYFRISQYEAELMSPEVRLMLEAGVEAFENAGYSRETMARRYGGDVAVIVGSMTNEYDLYGFQNMLVRGSLASGSYTGTVPNMISYFYGFTGPSYFLDTMCSASSTCVHEAVHMLRAGRCKMALAGGVSLLLHPQKLIATSQEHFTSKSADVIRGYGVGAEGTILGEGVGALVLKPLEDAQRDGDHVYGVIIGSGISNAGVRNGFTVPNPHQQTAAIEQALQDADISADTISYVEGHGSGTALGDPIEVRGLTQAFRKHTDAVQTVPIGTVKSNVGHLLAAAGMAGLAKVIAQLRHGQLAPSLHAEALNPDIPFETSPFYVQRALADWTRPRDADGLERPRRAGVTSIGAGGMNSHILIEEAPVTASRRRQGTPQLFVFSGVNQAALDRVLVGFASFLRADPDLDMADVAYSLQVGKNELTCRLTLIASTADEAVGLIQAHLARRSETLAIQETDQTVFVPSILEVDAPEEGNGIEGAAGARDLMAAARFWAYGGLIDWDAFQDGQDCRRLPLPQYPFERVRCWYETHEDAPSVIRPLTMTGKLHPLIGVNRSTLSGMKYETRLNLNDLRDYAVMVKRRACLLPTAPLEIAVALAGIAGLNGPIRASGLRVTASPDWSEVRRLQIDVGEISANGFGVSVLTHNKDGADEDWVHVNILKNTEICSTPTVALAASLPAGRTVEGANLLRIFANRGLSFGPYLEVIERATFTTDSSVHCALLQDHPLQDPGAERTVLPPRVLAGLYQALLLTADDAFSDIEAPVVSAVAALDISGDPAQTTALRVSAISDAKEGRQSFEALLLDAQGTVIAKLDGLEVCAPDRLVQATLSEQPVREPVREVAVVRPVSPIAQSDGCDLIDPLAEIAGDLLKFPADELGARLSFQEMGFDSISLTRFAAEISERFAVDLSPAVFFEHETLEALASHLIHRLPEKSRRAATAVVRPDVARPDIARQVSKPLTTAAVVKSAAPIAPSLPEAADDRVAIVGIAARLPGADDPDVFFDRLAAGEDLTRPLPLGRFGASYRARFENADFALHGGFLEDIDRFDAAFFKISPAEAERMDPQQRLMLETAWRCLEDAGLTPDALPRDTGVFVGVTSKDYADLLRAHDVETDGRVATGNSLAMVANRISHMLDLHGPSEAIDTACSSSLVALLRAAEAVREGKCGAALVGGVNLTLSADGFEGPHRAGMLSPDGRCKTFGDTADGYARGEGVVSVLLKPLATALRDGDRVYGIVIGGAINHGGRAGSLTAPNTAAQSELIVCAMRGIAPASIGYLEAHGTGTALGDPVELSALNRAYAELGGAPIGGTPIGSVKSNIGHLEAAAGLAALAKVLVGMRREVLPPSLHCDRANPHLELATSPFRVITAREHWHRRRDTDGQDLPLRAGISSFGFGGSNAHVVIEEAPRDYRPRRSPLPPHPFAQTRYWIPGLVSGERRGAVSQAAAFLPIDDQSVHDQAVMLLPIYQPEPGTRRGLGADVDRIVFACGVDVAADPSVQVIRERGHAESDASGDPAAIYARCAASLLGVLRDVARRRGGEPLLVQLVVPDQGVFQACEGLGALLHTAAEEIPRLNGQTIIVPENVRSQEIAEWLSSEGPEIDCRVRYESSGLRSVERWVAASDGPTIEPQTGDWPFTQGGSYLVTGGLGGLGRLLALKIAEKDRAAGIVLAGRSAPDTGGEDLLGRLSAMGVRAEHRYLDVCDAAAVEAMVGALATDGSDLRVFHCAGVLNDGLIAEKTDTDLRAVLAPKVAGSWALVEACVRHGAERLVLFSSLASAFGNFGQADYAAANGFMGAIAKVSKVPITVIDWPLWRDGGMSVSPDVEKDLFRRMGQRPLETEAGLQVMSDAISRGVPRCAVIAGDRARILSFAEGAGRASLKVTQRVKSSGISREVQDNVQYNLSLVLAGLIGFTPEEISASAPFEDFGIDSLLVAKLNAALDDAFPELPRTVFFEHRTLAALTAFLSDTFPDACQAWTGVASGTQAPLSETSPRSPSAHQTATENPQTGAAAIAIIGIAGRYPGAEDLEDFWSLLEEGRTAISDYPSARWGAGEWVDPDPDRAVQRGLSYTAKGGFLSDAETFDPAFFKISARDAAVMDPQERLMLMAAWAALEDAGYPPSRIKSSHGGRAGVFVGITKTGYALFGPFVTESGTRVRPNTSFASAANRVSHAFDFTGPSQPIDTMCSSSLTAVHEACSALLRGDCEVALAGGVNLYTHPSTYAELCASRMLSPDGTCRAFGAGANGFVPGEGVGCILLKPLSRALEDGDRVHAVIRGTAVNHGGHANGYTVPTASAQADVVRTALRAAGVSPKDVSYVEAHGTGTDLGDPIEVRGLSEVFGGAEGSTGRSIGSLKPNIGHLEAAAGIAGLTKLVLQMRHGRLAPSLHSNPGNPNIPFDGLPFQVQRTAADWRAEHRFAGVSSFGAGGANAHAILEQMPADKRAHVDPSGAARRWAIPLSAKDARGLREVAERLLTTLRTPSRPVSGARGHDIAEELRAQLAEILSVTPDAIDPDERWETLGLEIRHLHTLRTWLVERLQCGKGAIEVDFDSTIRSVTGGLEVTDVPARAIPPAIADIAFTLQVGREAMAHRLAFEVATIDDLVAALESYLADRLDHRGLYVGRPDVVGSPVSLLQDETDVGDLLVGWIEQGRLSKALRLWTAGLDIDWPRVWEAAHLRGVPRGIVSLPSYPFLRKRFWPPVEAGEASCPSKAASAVGAAILAPIPNADREMVEHQALEAEILQMLTAELRALNETEVEPGYRAWLGAARRLCGNLLNGGLDVAAAPDAAWRSWRAFAETHRGGGLSSRIELAETTLSRIGGILTGQTPATAVMFPNGALSLVEGVYKANPVAVGFSNGVAQAAAAFAAERAAAGTGESIRILEIGSGTGGTSEPVLRALNAYRDSVAEVRLTDVSRAFLIQAERKLGPMFPRLATSIFDVERSAAEQDLPRHSFDLVIAANVLHATADMRATLQTVREVMAPDGVLLLNETSGVTAFTHVTFGLLDGWWRFVDPEVRLQDSPSLSGESWSRLLVEAGFDVLARSDDRASALGQQLIAAQAVGGAPATARMPAQAPIPLPSSVSSSSGQFAITAAVGETTGDPLTEVLLRHLAQCLNMSPDELEVSRSFADYGLDSILGAEFVHVLSQELGVSIDQTHLYDHTTLDAFAQFLRAHQPGAVARFLKQTSSEAPSDRPDDLPDDLPTSPRVLRAQPSKAQAGRTSADREPIAIVGMSGRFAQSPDLQALWTHLLAGRDLVGSTDRFDIEAALQGLPSGDYGTKGSFLDDAASFDAEFFGISGLEATYMDPQQRLFLEEAWRALEDAGHAGGDLAGDQAGNLADGGRTGGRCGVFVGCSAGDYQELFDGDVPGQAFWGNTISLIPARIAYWLNLKGPAIAVDTACSSSLVAIHLACQSLWSGESDTALVGGVFVQSTGRFFRSANQARMLSASGRCAAFGADADGIVPGEAVGAVLLRPLADALADGDTVRGVIVASGTNQDGATNGITAPSALSQEALIRRVYDDFGLDPKSIGMVEAHGTGTPLGDPIEHAALSRSYASYGVGARSCALGSVKSNIGHATTAAGMAGLLKTLLSLQHETIPESLHFDGGNPKIGFEQTPFYVPTRPTPWPRKIGAVRRAAVSSFGFSGTNAHLVIEDAPQQTVTPDQAGPVLIVLSAKTAAALKQQAANLCAYLAANPHVALSDLAYTLLVGRRHMEYRLTLVADSVADLRDALTAWGEAVRVSDPDTQPEVTGLEPLGDLVSKARLGDRDALTALGTHYLARRSDGIEALFDGKSSRRIPLPTYPFQKTRYWAGQPPKQPTVQQEAVIESARQEVSQEVTPSGPIKLADKTSAVTEPVGLTSPVAAAAAPAKTRLKALSSFARPVANAHVEILDSADGLRRLTVDGAGDWQSALADALSDAVLAGPVTAVLVTLRDVDEAVGPASDAARASPLPVVAAVTGEGAASARAWAEHADFGFVAPNGSSGDLVCLPGEAVEQTALNLAQRIASAPRASLIALKRHMRHDRIEVPEVAVAPSIDLVIRPDAMPSSVGGAPHAAGAVAKPIDSQSEVVALERYDDGVAVLHMREIEQSNCFTPAFMDGLSEAFQKIANDVRIKAVVLTGFGPYFASGGTREGLSALQRGETRFTDRQIYALPLMCDVPVVAAMSGHAIGAGWSLGMFADATIFAREAVYHSNYLWFGFTPGAGATMIFPARLGDRLGREVLFGAQAFKGAGLAKRSDGLVVLESAAVLPAAIAHARRLAAHPRDALIRAKSEACGGLRAALDRFLSAELAMHQTTLVGNDQVVDRINEMFPQSEAPVSDTATSDPAISNPAAKGDGGTPSTSDLPDLPGLPGLPGLRGKLIASLAGELMIDAEAIRGSAQFMDLGMDSILAVIWLRRVNETFGVDLPATAVYAHPTVDTFVAHLTQLVGVDDSPATSVRDESPAPQSAQPSPPDANARSRMRDLVVASLASELMIERTSIRDEAGFLDLGLDSILAVTWLRSLNGELGTDLPATSVYAYPTVGAFVDHACALVGEIPAEEGSEPEPAAEPPRSGPPILATPKPATPVVAKPAPVLSQTSHAGSSIPGPVAIIGASGRYPKAVDLDAFWSNIRDGRDCIEEVPADRWDVSRHYHPDPNTPDTSYCKWMGRIDGIAEFDAGFFNITPLEAELMDPQQRMFLQHAWHAIEDAAIDPQQLAGSKCGVFASAGLSGYETLIETRNAYSLLGKAGSILAARISYLLDLHGPSLSVDTACSSSLVAIAEACESVSSGRCDTALAGGACVMIGPSMFIETSKVGMLSADGRCFTFDARANGFVPGEGVGVLMLKRLSDAVRDGDPIRAVVRGWGSNQDGRTNGITAPNPKAQARLIRDVHDRFSLDPATIGLVECHGTGTPLGDPIEIEGLTEAFSGTGLTDCVLGSAKANVGHLLASAGVAGATKAMLSLENAVRPPLANFSSLNQHIRLDDTPFRIETEARGWETAEHPRRAGVSSFGFSGTNAHLVLEEAPEPARRDQDGMGPYLLVISAADRAGLARQALSLSQYLESRSDLRLEDIAFTLQNGRSGLAWRCAFVFENLDELRHGLAATATDEANIVDRSRVRSGHVDPDEMSRQAADADLRALTTGWLQTGTRETLDRLAKLWVDGAPVDWLAGQKGARISLPGYAFAAKRHWVAEAAVEPVAVVKRHPFLDADRCRIADGVAQIVLAGDEDFLTHAVIGDRRVLPGLFLPELAVLAAERAEVGQTVGLRQVIWGAPISVNGAPVSVTLEVRARALDGASDEMFAAWSGENRSEPCFLGTFMPAGAAQDLLKSIVCNALNAPDGSDVTETYRRFAEQCATVSGPPAPEALSVSLVYTHGDGLEAKLIGSVAEAGGRQPAGRQSENMCFNAYLLDPVLRLLSFWHRSDTDTGAESCALRFLQSAESIVSSGQGGDEVRVRIHRRGDAGAADISIRTKDGTALVEMRGVRTAMAERLRAIRIDNEVMG